MSSLLHGISSCWYGLLVTAKLLAGASHPFMFPNGGWRILITVWLVELVILGLLLANRSIRNALKLQQEAAAFCNQFPVTAHIASLILYNPSATADIQEKLLAT